MGGVPAIELDEMGLTPKQAVFTREYLRTRNGTQAAAHAYPSRNRNTSAVISSENLRKPNVIAAIERSVRREAVTPARVLDDLKFVVKVGKREGKLDSVINAAAWMGKHLGMFKDSTASSGAIINLTLNQFLIEGMEPPSDVLNAEVVSSNDPLKIDANVQHTPNKKPSRKSAKFDA